MHAYEVYNQNGGLITKVFLRKDLKKAILIARQYKGLVKTSQGRMVYKAEVR